MPIDIHWRQWEPTPNTHWQVDQSGKIISGVLRSMSSPDKETGFVKLFNQWNVKFPNKLFIATLTNSPWPSGDFQLRMWFGKPRRFETSFVDSGGYNLIVSVWGRPREVLDELLTKILPSDDQWVSAIHKSGVTIWCRRGAEEEVSKL